MYFAGFSNMSDSMNPLLVVYFAFEEIYIYKVPIKFLACDVSDFA